jgi:predicted Ser/Thr protein kinase
MTPERLRSITDIVHAALARDATERESFVAACCGDDADLRREVEAMLARQREADPVTGTTAFATTETFDAASAFEGPTLAPGSQFGSYEIVSLLGSGGMGEVYLAHDTVLRRKVAIKLLRADLTRHPALIARFEQEARAASALNHPNIVTIYETRFAAERRFIAMEYVDGRPLSALVGTPNDASTVRPIARQLGEALKVAHAAGIIHRDLKPANIMVRADGYIKLVDFGIARLSLAGEHDSLRPVRTGVGALLGTPRYMSPEQIRGEPATKASDVFSLGAVMHELATGKHPSENDPSPKRPDPLHALIQRMLAAQPAERPSAADVEQEIRRLEAAAVPLVGASRRNALVIAAVLALAVLVWLAVAAYRAGREQGLLQARVEATAVFFNLRALDRNLVRLRQQNPRSNAVRDAAAQRDKLAQTYDNYVELLGLYRGKSPTEVAILRLARRLGEVDLEVPAGFNELTMEFVQRWSRTQRLTNRVTAARQSNLIFRIVKTLQAKGLPKELALIALQESDFETKAIGPPGRAGVPKGLWQLTEGTAGRYGLRLGPLSGQPVYDAADERHDEVRSTEAATNHVVDLYSSTAAASALLVIASYSSGEGVVQRRLETMPDDPRVRNFWNVYNDPWLPLETRDYVMYVFTAALICEQPDLFGFSFERIW